MHTIFIVFIIYSLCCKNLFIHVYCGVTILVSQLRYGFFCASPRRVSRGGLGPPPPLEIEKQKKVISANFKLFHLYFATFLVENITFSAIF